MQTSGLAELQFSLNGWVGNGIDWVGNFIGADTGGVAVADVLLPSLNDDCVTKRAILIQQKKTNKNEPAPIQTICRWLIFFFSLNW
jgi:hypothetical protein